MRLVSYLDRDAEALGVVIDGDVHRASALAGGAPRTIDELLRAPDAGLRVLGDALAAGAPETAGVPLADVSLLAPVPRPPNVIAIGRNYREHAEEEGVEAPAAPPIFLKATGSVVGHGEPIRWDPQYAAQVDYEAELAIVIGRPARHVSAAEALDHVLGYTCLNDVSARDLQFGDVQWARGKSLDTFCPMGPALVTRDEIPDPQDLAISCRVNGQVMQSAATSQMYFSVADIIAHCSHAFTLRPGDVIATGTPGGVGVFRDPPVLLQDGDEVVVEVERVGRLVNVCRTEALVATAEGAA